MAAKYGADPAFRERFDRRCELFLDGLRGAVVTLPSVTCGPIDRDATFGWSFEQGDTGHRFENEGGLDYALSYLRHMIGQGFHVAYAVSLADSGVVHLQVWESPQMQKPWPADTEIVFTAIWHTMVVSQNKRG